MGLCSYPALSGSSADGAEVVVVVLLGHTLRAHQLLIVQAEQLHVQRVLRTQQTSLFTRNPAALLLNEGVTGALQGSVDWRLLDGRCLLADGALLSPTLSPAGLQAGLTETVGAEKN